MLSHLTSVTRAGVYFRSQSSTFFQQVGTDDILELFVTCNDKEYIVITKRRGGETAQYFFNKKAVELFTYREKL